LDAPGVVGSLGKQPASAIAVTKTAADRRPIALPARCRIMPRLRIRREMRNDILRATKTTTRTGMACPREIFVMT
jgi:hypothetical protein